MSDEIYTIIANYQKFQSELMKQNIKYCEEIERLNNIIGTIKGMFNDCDNHFEDGCDCKRIEEFLRIVGSDKE